LLGGDGDQRVPVADVTAVFEVSGVHGVDHRFFLVVRREDDQAMRQHRVRRSFDALKVECQSHFSPGATRSGEELLRRDPAASLRFHEGSKRMSLRRNVLVQEEGAVTNVHRFALPLRQRQLQMTLADTAPGTNCIVKNLYLHRFSS
jgi:hypothetical protein